MGMEIAIAFENVEFIRRLFLVLLAPLATHVRLCRYWCAYVAAKRPCPSPFQSVLGSVLLCTKSNAKIEVTKDKLDGWEKQCCKRYLQRAWVGFLLLNVPAQRIRPRHTYVRDLDTARFRQTEANVVPVMSELDARLVCLCKGEDVVPSVFVDTLKNSKVRNNATRVEELEPIEDNVVAIGFDGKITVSRINGAANEIVVLDDELLDAIGLFS